MRTLLSTAFMLLAIGAPAAAQGSHFGIQGGVVYSPTTAYLPGGWGVGITVPLGAPSSDPAFRLEANYTQLGPAPAPINPGGGGGGFTSYSALGASANVLASVFGAPEHTSLYLIAGLGYYGVRSTVTGSTGREAGRGPILGAFGYNGGLGLRFSSLFLEVRYAVIKNGASAYWPGTPQDLVSIPLTLGFSF